MVKVQYRYCRRVPRLDLARAALRKGPMIKRGRFYITHDFGQRHNIQTIDKLIASGEAVLIGDGVAHIDHVREARDVLPVVPSAAIAPSADAALTPRQHEPV